MAVPFIDLKRFEDGFLDRWQEICAHITRNTQFVGGPEAERLETSLAERAGIDTAVGCANGTDAIQLALRAAGVGPGDTVAVPDATFWATFEAVVNVGARVITVDIDPDDLQMDFDLLAEVLDRRQPKAVILVHLYGWGSARLEDFRRLCREREVLLIEDGAQALDARRHGEPIFADSELATLSFYPAKVLGSCGDAGAVLHNRRPGGEDLAQTVRLLGNHGRTSHYGHGLVGWNSRMGGFDAAFLNLSLEYLDGRIESRRRLAARYRERLAELDTASRGVQPVAPPEGYEENGYLNVLRVDPDLRPKLQEALRAAEIGFGTVYPGAISKQPGAAPFLEEAVGGERADELSKSVLNLPLFAHMEDHELDEVIDVVDQAI